VGGLSFGIIGSMITLSLICAVCFFVGFSALMAKNRKRINRESRLKQLEERTRELEREIVIGVDSVYEDNERWLAETAQILNRPWVLVKDEDSAPGEYWGYSVQRPDLDEHPLGMHWEQIDPKSYPNARPRSVYDSIERNKKCRRTALPPMGVPHYVDVDQKYTQCRNCGHSSRLVKSNGYEYCPICSATVATLYGPSNEHMLF
jgi:hypothetical protein